MKTHLNLPQRALAIQFCGALLPNPSLINEILNNLSSDVESRHIGIVPGPAYRHNTIDLSNRSSGSHVPPTQIDL